MKPKITLIGTLLQIKGISPYCQQLLKSLSKRIGVEFIGFRKLYPDFLYPGGSKVIDKDYEVSKTKQFKSRKLQNLQYHVIIVSGGLND